MDSNSSDTEKSETKIEKNWKENLYEIFKEFFHNTTAHGFNSLISSDGAILKFLWLTIIIGSYCYLVINIRDLYELYAKKPLLSSLSLSNNKELDYPTILVCNLNPVKKSLISNLTKNLHKGSATLDNQLDNELSFYRQYGELAKKFEKYVQNFSQPYSEFILGCSWRYNVDCKDKWRPFWNWRYGTCFAYNSLEDNSTVTIRRAGFSSLLHIQLFLNKQESFSPITIRSGARVFIGEPGTFFAPEYEGYGLVPGLHHEFRIKSHKIKRLDPFQDGRCRKRDIKDTQSEFQKITKYTQRYCRNRCYEESDIKYCNCTSVESATSFKNICAQNQYDCTSNTPVPTTCIDSCTPPCHETKYTTTISTEKSELYPPTLKGDDIVSLSIYFDDMESVVLEEKLQYTTSDFISGIGGSFGLFSGYSLMTFFELLILVCTFIIFGMKKLSRKNKICVSNR